MRVVDRTSTRQVRGHPPKIRRKLLVQSLARLGGYDVNVVLEELRERFNIPAEVIDTIIESQVGRDNLYLDQPLIYLAVDNPTPDPEDEI